MSEIQKMSAAKEQAIRAYFDANTRGLHLIAEKDLAAHIARTASHFGVPVEVVSELLAPALKKENDRVKDISNKK